jgi:hypothetical protein
MKKLEEYLMESAKQYEYRIKIAGDLPKENYEALKRSLDMFDVDECTSPKKTPIMSDPLGFPGLKNEEINVFDVKLNYPASTQQIVELARQHGIDPAKIVVVDKAFNDSMNADLEVVDNDTVLLDSDYPENSKEQKEASDAYADSYKKAAAEFANDGSAKFEIAGKESASVKYNTDNEAGKDSPMSKIKRRPKKDIYK